MAKRSIAITAREDGDFARVLENDEEKRYHPDTLKQISAMPSTLYVRESGSDHVRVEYQGRKILIPRQDWASVRGSIVDQDGVENVIYDVAPVRDVSDRFVEATGRAVGGTIEALGDAYEAAKDPGAIAEAYSKEAAKSSVRDRLREGTPQAWETLAPDSPDRLRVQSDMLEWEKLTGRPWMNEAEIQALPPDEARAVMAAQGTMFENTYRGVADIGHQVKTALSRAYDDPEPVKAMAGTLAAGAGGIVPFMTGPAAAADVAAQVASAATDPESFRENPSGLALELLGPVAGAGGAKLARRVAHGKAVTPAARAALDEMAEAANTASSRVDQPVVRMPEPDAPAAPRPLASAPILNVADELASIQRTGDVPGSAARAVEAPAAPLTPPPRVLSPEDITPPPIRPLPAAPGRALREQLDQLDPESSLAPVVEAQLAEAVTDPPKLKPPRNLSPVDAARVKELDDLEAQIGKVRSMMDEHDRLSLLQPMADDLAHQPLEPSRLAKTYADLLVKRNGYKLPQSVGGQGLRADTPAGVRTPTTPETQRAPNLASWADEPTSPRPELLRTRTPQAELVDMIADDLYSAPPSKPRSSPPAGSSVVEQAPSNIEMGPRTLSQDAPALAQSLGFKPEYLRVLQSTLGKAFEQTLRRALDGDNVAMLHMSREYGRVVALRKYLESGTVLADEAVPTAARRVEMKAFKNVMRAVVDTDDLLHVNGTTGWASINMPAVKVAKVDGKTMVRVEGDLARAMPGLGGKWVPIEDARSFAARYGKPNTSFWQSAGRFTKANMTSRRLKTHLVAFLGDMNLQIMDGGSPSSVFSGIRAVMGYSKNSGRSELARFFVRSTAGESVSGSMMDRSATTGPELESMIKSGRLSLENAHADKRIMHDGEMVLRDHLLITRLEDAAFKGRMKELGRDGWLEPLKEFAATAVDSNPLLRFLGSGWHIRDAGNRYALFERALHRELPGLNLRKASPEDVQRIISEKPAEVRRAMAHAEQYGFGLAESSPVLAVSDAVVPFMFPRFMAHSTAVMMDSAQRWWPQYVALAKAAREMRERDPYIDPARMTRRLFGGRARDEFLVDVGDGSVWDMRMATATAVPVLMGEFFEGMMPIVRDELTGKITLDFGPIQEAFVMLLTGQAPDGRNIFTARSPTGGQQSREQSMTDLARWAIYVGAIRGISPGLYADVVDATIKTIDNQRWLGRPYTAKEAFLRATVAANPEPSAAMQNIRYNSGMAPQSGAANKQRRLESQRQVTRNGP